MVEPHNAPNLLRIHGTTSDPKSERQNSEKEKVFSLFGSVKNIQNLA